MLCLCLPHSGTAAQWAPGFSAVLPEESPSQQSRTESTVCVKAAQHLSATRKPMGDWAGSVGGNLVWGSAVSASSLLRVPRFGWLGHALLPCLEPQGWRFHPKLWHMCSPVMAATPKSTLRPYRLRHNNQIGNSLALLFYTLNPRYQIRYQIWYQILWENIMTPSLCSLPSANLWLENL